MANFVDIAEKAGLTMKNVFGGLDTKKYIIETTGTGVAIFDYDNDGWPDIFFVNGTTLEDAKAGKSGPTNHLYHNKHDGTFTDVTHKAGLDVEMFGLGVAVGDYDNDGYDDLFVTAYGQNHLFHNNGNGTFTDVTQKAGFGGVKEGFAPDLSKGEGMEAILPRTILGAAGKIGVLAGDTRLLRGVGDAAGLAQGGQKDGLPRVEGHGGTKTWPPPDLPLDQDCGGEAAARSGRP